MKSEDCPKLNECYKVKMILDKDLLDFQYAEAIRAVCAKCDELSKARERNKPTPNPYPEIFVDEISGVEVPDHQHRIWDEGYEASQRDLNGEIRISNNP